jgi:hypothetical protein
LGDQPQIRQVAIEETLDIEHVNQVRGGRQQRDPVSADLVGEIRIGDRPVVQHHRSARPKLRMEDRQAEAVVQRQRGDRAIGGRYGQCGDDRVSIAHQIAAAEPYQPRRTGTTRSAQQQSELRVKIMRVIRIAGLSERAVWEQPKVWPIQPGDRRIIVQRTYPCHVTGQQNSQIPDYQGPLRSQRNVYQLSGNRRRWKPGGSVSDQLGQIAVAEDSGIVDQRRMRRDNASACRTHPPIQHEHEG